MLLFFYDIYYDKFSVEYKGENVFPNWIVLNFPFSEGNKKQLYNLY